MFSPETQQQVDRILSRYPIRRNALIPILHLAQKENQGWLDSKWMNHVAELCEVSPTHVEGVATFYTMFRFRPPGKYHLQVCTCVPCCLVGGPEILEHLEQRLDIHAGHTTEDGLFSIEEMECIGACAYAPAMIVNEDYVEKLTPEKVDQLLTDLGHRLEESKSHA